MITSIIYTIVIYLIPIIYHIYTPEMMHPFMVFEFPPGDVAGEGFAKFLRGVTRLSNSAKGDGGSAEECGFHFQKKMFFQ